MTSIIKPTETEKLIIAREKKLIYNKAYYQKNREKLLEYSNIKRFCEACNHTYKQSHWKRHLKTKKHKKNLEKLNK